MPKVSIVMRSRNDADIIERTLEALKRQDYSDWELINIDSSSTDGTTEKIAQLATNQKVISTKEYIPGKVLNDGATLSHGQMLVFLNSDCVPLKRNWLRCMVEGIETNSIVFGRQVARKDAWLLYERDYMTSFPPVQKQARRSWRHNQSFQNFFSMANCGMKKEVWEAIPFDEELGFSEDIDWAVKAKKAGYRIAYLPEAAVEHSHNYSAEECFHRFYGEGVTDGLLFSSHLLRDSFMMMVALPYLSALKNDFVYAHRQKRWKDWLPSLRLRWSMHLGRYRGLNYGRETGEKSFGRGESSRA